MRYEKPVLDIFLLSDQLDVITTSSLVDGSDEGDGEGW